MNQLTTQELEAIRKRAEQAKVNPFQLGEISVAKRYPYEDVTKLLAEVERLQTKLSNVESLLTEAHDVMDDVHLYDTALYVDISKYLYGEEAIK